MLVLEFTLVSKITLVQTNPRVLQSIPQEDGNIYWNINFLKLKYLHTLRAKYILQIFHLIHLYLFEYTVA